MADQEKRAYKRTESWGAIRRLPSGRYQASYPGPDGQRYTARTDANAPLTFTTKADARAWLQDSHRSIARGTWEPPEERAMKLAAAAKEAGARTFGAYAIAWLAERVSGKGDPLRPKTRAGVRAPTSNGARRVQRRSDRRDHPGARAAVARNSSRPRPHAGRR